VALLLIAPAILLLLVIHDEVLAMVDSISQLRGANIELPPVLREIPGLGAFVQRALDRYILDPEATRHAIDDWFGALNTDRTSAAIAVLRNLAKLLLALLTLFYLYRDGSQLCASLRGLWNRVFGGGIARYLDSAGAMVRAVVYGLLASALAQGLLATGGYLIVGAAAPVLLGALTVIAAVVPLFGTVLVWGPVAASMLVAGHATQAGILVAWGVLIVNPADNVIKLLVISGATEMPILLVLFGVVGGLASFGLIGVFIGPVALAIATAVWRDLAREASETSVAPGGNGPHSV
jgi:predicted PurR-regulated permease PerM